MELEINFIAVILAAITSMVVGFTWYSEPLFGKSWMKLMGLSAKSLKEKQKEMGMLYTLSMFAALVTAFVLSHVTTMSEAYFLYPRFPAALSSAFWMWLGFVAPVQMTDVIFGGKSWNLFFINTGYQFAALLAMGAVIGLM